MKVRCIFVCVVFTFVLFHSYQTTPIQGRSDYSSLKTRRWAQQKMTNMTKPARSPAGKDDDHAIFFPDAMPVPIPPSFIPKPSGGNKCIDGICDEVDDYPEEYIKYKLKQMREMGQYFQGSDVTVTLSDRLGPDEGETLCKVVVHTQYPKKAKNINKTEKFIVNIEGHIQGLVFETCVPKAKCMFSDIFPNSYESQCVQKYSVRRLMALGTNGETHFDNFEVPSCCVCTILRKT